ncbi:MAG: anthranilate phosphoribosyltransferase [Candidatus Peregrinibacteria bacterium]
MKTLILDNYDSFTFNLYQEIGELGGNPIVECNDAVSIDDIRRLHFTHIIISPGPGNPSTKRDIGISEELIDYAAAEKIPLLGVCLGHQVLGKHFGATVSRAPSVFHGKASSIQLRHSSPLFAGIVDGFEAMRYHSLCVEPETLPPEFHVTAETEDGVVMAMEHESLPLFGVQFHPESIGTPSGKSILKNFLSLASSTREETDHQSIESLLYLLLSEATSEDQRNQAFQKLVQLPMTPDVLADGVLALRKRMVPVSLGTEAIDTCGTGGSGKRTINTSTLTAFLVAAAGGKVAKHGNRSASGNCGCFDLLKHLGVNIMLSPEAERRLFDELGIVFLFAPLHHPALRFVALLRKRYGKKTIFNFLGPLCNPAGATHQLLGTGKAEDATMLAESLKILGIGRGIVVSGLDGLDEVSVCAPTVIRNTETGKEEFFLPSDLGLPIAQPSAIEGGSAEENAKIFAAVAKGEGTEAQRNLVLVNASHALLLAGAALSLRSAFFLARKTLDSGAVHALFLRYRDLSQQYR